MNKSEKRRGRPDLQGSADLDVHLLDTAARLFAENGYDGTSMDRVAAAAGAGKQSLYRRYATKEELFAAVSSMMIARVMDGWRTRIADMAAKGVLDIDDPLEDLRRIARMIMEFILEPQTVSVFAMLVSERLRLPHLNADVGAMGKELENQLTRRIVSAQNLKLLRADIDPNAPRHLMGLTTGWPVVQGLLGEPGLDSEEQRDRFFDSAWQVFLDSTAPRISSDASASDRRGGRSGPLVPAAAS